MPQISIILPVYNSESYLSKCLDSILGQTNNNWELIIVDDGSVDSSLEICNEYSKFNARISVISAPNGGASYARNIGLEYVATPYVTFVDSDDYIESDYIDTLLSPLVKDEEIDLVTSNFVEYSIYYPYGVEVLNSPKFNNDTKIERKNYIKYLFEGINGVLWGKSFKMKIIKEYSIRLNEKVHLQEDLIFVLEYLNYSKFIYKSNSLIYNYNRLNENNLSGKLTLENLSDIEITNRVISSFSGIIEEDFEDIFEKRNVDFFKKLSFDIQLSDKSKKDRVKDIDFLLNKTFLNSYFKSHNVTESIHFWLLNKRLILMDFFFVRILFFLKKNKIKIKKSSNV